MKQPVRRLVVNADDFGFTRDVNAGIVEAHRNGILTATTLMATGGRHGAFDDAVRLAKETPRSISAAIWCWSEPPDFRSPSRSWCAPWRSGAFASMTSWSQQVRRIVDAGLSPRISIPTSTRICFRRCWTPWHAFPRSSKSPGCGARSIFRCSRAACGWKRQPVLMRLDERALSRRAGDASLPLDGSVRGFQNHRPLRQRRSGQRDSRAAGRRRPSSCAIPAIAATNCVRRARALKESREEELRALTAPEVRRALAEAGVDDCVELSADLYMYISTYLC